MSEAASAGEMAAVSLPGALPEEAPARFARRRAAVLGLVNPPVEAMLITRPVHVSYLTNFSGDDSALVLMPERAVLVTDGRFTEQAAEECPGLELSVRPSGTTLTAAIGELLREASFKTVGVESIYISHAMFRELADLIAPAQLSGVGHGPVETLRLCKDADELAQLREAIRFAEEAFVLFRQQLTWSETEKTLFDRMEMLCRQCGATRTAFDSIIAAGPRAALPHAPPTLRRVGDEDFLLVDWGARGRFYHSDLTRVLVKGTIPPQLRTIYDIVREAQDAAFAMVRPGAKWSAIDQAARAVITAAGYGKMFVHSTGHGLGMEVHEAPALRATESGDSRLLQPGMVLTLEPGIYLPRWGGVRLEDDVLVTATGAERLTTLPRLLDDCLC